jgi:hypothetical protein
MLKQIRRNEISSPQSAFCKTKRVYSIVVVASITSACTVFEGSQRVMPLLLSLSSSSSLTATGNETTFSYNS